MEIIFISPKAHLCFSGSVYPFIAVFKASLPFQSSAAAAEDNENQSAIKGSKKSITQVNNVRNTLFNLSLP